MEESKKVNGWDINQGQSPLIEMNWWMLYVMDGKKLVEHKQANDLPSVYRMRKALREKYPNHEIKYREFARLSLYGSKEISDQEIDLWESRYNELPESLKKLASS